MSTETENWLAQLPESRSTQRLLDILSRLEAYLANLAAADASHTGQPKGGGTAVIAEITRLRDENKSLRLTQRHAVERLDNLLERLPALLEDPEQPQEDAA